jgi:OOP family OmpA-OmpF porin
MTPAGKILLGALATTAVAWWLHGPMGFARRCADEARANAAAPAISGEAAASAQTVIACQTKVDAAVAGKTVKFGSGGTQVAAQSKDLLDALGASLKDCAGTVVEIAGHTDRAGDAGRNMALSLARANAVRAALVQRGVPADRLGAKGYGETRPGDPTGPESNPADRRIEFAVSAASAAAVGASSAAN